MPGLWEACGLGGGGRQPEVLQGAGGYEQRVWQLKAVQPLGRVVPRVQSAQLLHNEKEVDPMNPVEIERNVRDYGNDFSF